MSRPLVAIAVVAALALAGCGTESIASGQPTTAEVTRTSPPPSTSPSGSSAPATTTSTTTSTTTTSTMVVAPSTTVVAPVATAAPVEPSTDPGFLATRAQFDALARSNAAVSMTVVRDGRPAVALASGTTIDGSPATSDSPMVVASVGKLITATMIARLEQAGVVDVAAPIVWSELGIDANPGWADVTPRELLDHTSGMPVVRGSWFDGGLDCATFLASVLTTGPTSTRGRWTYSNGNYCALGLLVEHVTGLKLDEAAQRLVFDPLGVTGIHLTTDGQSGSDIGYRLGVERLSRLGGAGTFLVSTDDLAITLATLTPADLTTLQWPGVFVDQYGWGHTGSVDGAVSCAWVLEDGRTIVAATVAGSSPSTGGAVCDRVVPAVASDLGIGQGVPDRSPR